MKTLLSFLIFYMFFLQPAFGQIKYKWGFQLFGDSYCLPTSLKVDNFSNVLIAGVYGSGTDFDPGPGEYLLEDNLLASAFMAKYDEYGNFLWAYDLDMGSNTSNNNLLPVVEINEENEIFLTGFKKIGAISSFYLAKYKSNGGLLWELDFTGEDPSSGEAIVPLADGGVVVTGKFTGVIDFDPGQENAILESEGNNDFFLARYSESGDLIWVKKMGGMTFSQSAFAHLDVDDNGNIYAGGYLHNTFDFDPENPQTDSELSCQGYRAFLAKYSDQGELAWVHQIESTEQSSIFELCVDTNNDVIIIGRFQDSVDLDLGQETEYWSTPGSIGAMVAKYNSQGQLIWGFGLNTSFKVGFHGIALDAQNYIHVTGYFGGEEVDVDPSDSEVFIQNTGLYDHLYCLYTSDGEFERSFSISTDELEVGGFIDVDPIGKVYLTGSSTSDSIDLDATTETDIHYGTHQNLFVVKYVIRFKMTLSNRTDKLGEKPALIYPNPSKIGASLNYDVSTDEIDTVELLDSSGRVIRRWDATDEWVSPGIPGAYFLRIAFTNGSSVIDKILVQ